MEDKAMLRVGVLGVGGISGTHIPAWKRIKEAELCALCDIRPEQMEAYVGLPHYTDAKEMLDKENLDILDICLPTYLHAVYEYDDFFISAEASWYASPYPFQASFRFQFERAVIANEAGRLMVYEKDGKTFQAGADEQQSGTINLPQTDGYYNEIRYFTDCVLAGRDADIVKQEELETVLDLLTAL